MNSIDYRIERIDAWQDAAKDVPSFEDMDTLRTSLHEARALAEDAEREYARACVAKACVYGWVNIANDENVSPRQLHVWHRRYAPGMVDLSTVPVADAVSETNRLTKRLARLDGVPDSEAERKRITDRIAKLSSITK